MNNTGTSSNKYFKYVIAAGFLILVFHAYTLSFFSEDFGMHGSTAEYIHDAALSNLRNGLHYTWGLEVVSNAPAPLDLGTYGGHHPPGITLLMTAVYALTDSREPWLLRLVPMLLHFMGAGFFFLLVRRLQGMCSAFLAVSVYLFFPLSIHWGRMAIHEAPTMAFAMAASYLLHRYFTEAWAGSLVLSLLSIACSCAMGWPGYFYAAGLGILALCWSGIVLKKRVIVFASFATVSTMILLLILLQQYLAMGNVSALFAAGSRRIGQGGVEQYTEIRSLVPYLREWVQKQWLFIQMNFGIPLSFAALLSFIGLVVSKEMRKASGALRFLVLTLSVAVLHILLLHFGSFIHNFWQFYMIPPMAIAIGSIPLFCGNGRGPGHILFVMFVYGMLLQASLASLPRLFGQALIPFATHYRMAYAPESLHDLEEMLIDVDYLSTGAENLPNDPRFVASDGYSVAYDAVENAMRIDKTQDKPVGLMSPISVVNLKPGSLYLIEVRVKTHGVNDGLFTETQIVNNQNKDIRYVSFPKIETDNKEWKRYWYAFRAETEAEKGVIFFLRHLDYRTGTVWVRSVKACEID